jgi:RNA polymerase sigma factor (sigma-70 family)
MNGKKIEDYLPTLNRLARKFPDKHEDLVSEGIISLYTSYKKYDPTIGSFEAYAIDIAYKDMLKFYELDRVVRTCRNIKSKFKAGGFIPHTFPYTSVQATLNPVLSIDGFDFKQHSEDEIDEDTPVSLRRAISLLDDRKQTLVKLRFFEGKTSLQISERLSLTRQRIHQLEKEALTSLKENISVE